MSRRPSLSLASHDEDLFKKLSISLSNTEITNNANENHRKKLILLVLCVNNFCAATLFSVLAPFFPSEAEEKKGVSTAVVGFIFAEYQLIMFLFSPLFGEYLSRIGMKFTYIMGTLVASFCALLFGVLEYCPPGVPFIVMCFLVRGVTGLGAAAFVTASFTIITLTYPDKVSTMFGVLEACTGFGMMVGPLIGGVLFQYGGFKMPFIVLGGFQIFVALISIWVLPVRRDNDLPANGSILSLLVNWEIILLLITLVAASSCLGFIDPVLEPYLKKQFNLSPIMVGVVFFLAPGVYGFTAPVWGFVADKKHIGRPALIVGFLILGICTWFVGPVSFFNISPTLWLTIVALLIFGIGVGGALVPTAGLLIEAAIRGGYPNDFTTFSKVAGLLNGGFCFGAFVGPLTAGALVEKIEFTGSTLVYGCILFAMVPIVFLYMVILKCQYAIPILSVKPNDDNLCVNETNPLLAATVVEA